jgi:hypothetical protein
VTWNFTGSDTQVYLIKGEKGYEVFVEWTDDPDDDTRYLVDQYVEFYSNNGSFFSYRVSAGLYLHNSTYSYSYVFSFFFFSR